MKAAEFRTTPTAQPVPVKRDERQPFFRKEGRRSLGSNGRPAFFSGNGAAKGTPLIQRQVDAGGAAGAPPTSTTTPQPTPAAASRTFTNNVFNRSFSRFDLTYTPVGPDPAVGTLEVEMRVHFTFRGRFTDAERQQYTQDFEQSVEAAWSGQHILRLNDPNMDTHRCTVNINVVTVDDPANAHFRAVVARRADNFRSNVDGNRVELDDNDADDNKTKSVTRADFFKQVGDFDFDSAALNPEVEADLGEVESFLLAVPTPIRASDDYNNMISIEYFGRASSEGSAWYNRRLAERRIETVQNHINAAVPDLMSIGLNHVRGETHTEAESKYRRVDVKIDLPNTTEPTETTQNTAAHEAGHMFGLGDEYIEERPEHRFEGDTPRFYDAVSDRIGADAAEEMRVGNNESIMSHGMEVHRGHYITFVVTLGAMTGTDNWTVE